jgi:hypothetical protein
MLGDAIRDALPRLRAQAESMMVDACTVRRVTGELTDDDGNVSNVYAAVYDGKCRVPPPTVQASTPEVGGATVTVRRQEVHFPVGAFRPAVGQVIDITGCPTDPFMVGRVFRVTDPGTGANATAYRVAVEEVS